MHEDFYKNNSKYSDFLELQDRNIFKKYVDVIEKFCSEDSSFLDVGCGTGKALSVFKKKINLFGVDISDTSVKKCKEKNINCVLYDGKKIPFKSNYFDLVGSYNVLEHVDNPLDFLNEQLRVIKSGGCLVIVCPNFLSISNSYHWHTRGFFQKIKNIIEIAKKNLCKKSNFEKMKTVINESNYASDDDACNVTNPSDILKWAKNKNLKLKYWSSGSIYRKGIIRCLDFSIIRYFLGSSFFVFQKK